jgi:hypothetical protein
MPPEVFIGAVVVAKLALDPGPWTLDPGLCVMNEVRICMLNELSVFCSILVQSPC